VETSNEKKKTITQKIVVRAPLVRAVFTERLVSDLKMRFSGLESTGIIDDYKWFFGDDTNGIGPVVEHEYRKAGTYRVRLKTIDKRGIISQIEKEVKVESIENN
jgi:PKD repeat protein